jgi:hypothetical protein
VSPSTVFPGTGYNLTQSFTSVTRGSACNALSTKLAECNIDKNKFKEA